MCCYYGETISFTYLDKDNDIVAMPLKEPYAVGHSCIFSFFAGSKKNYIYSNTRGAGTEEVFFKSCFAMSKLSVSKQLLENFHVWARLWVEK